jgi:pyridoxal phosphate enzyme (YggS family)
VGEITANIRRVLGELPPGVLLVAAAKGRPVEQIQEAVEAGVTVIGENYVQEAEAALTAISLRVKWHFIGRLQRNKTRKAVGLFDMVQTIDSITIARDLDARCAQAGRSMPVLIEINSAREPAKSGVFPEHVEVLVRAVAALPNLRVQGLMTMGPAVDSAEEIRPFLALTRRTFEVVKSLALPGVEMKYLSMGMSDSYQVAISEGANMVRLGREIFGKRS